MPGGEALDLALGLLRAPARRELLAVRPLPDGMTALLEVAGGSTSAAQSASARTGAAPEELLEASRFFIQQILFTDQADPYRILGASPGAEQSTLNTHHRLLQRWLHPDRDGSEAWDSAFSSRVNAAWARVRNPRARSAYDAERAIAADAPAAPPPPTGWRRPPRPGPAGDTAPTAMPPRPGITGPLMAIAAALACLALVWLVYQRDLREQAELFPADRVYAPEAASPPANPVADHTRLTNGDTPAPADDTPLTHEDMRTSGDTLRTVNLGDAPDAPDAAGTPVNPAVGHLGPTYGDTSQPPGDTPLIPAGRGYAPDTSVPTSDSFAPDVRTATPLPTAAHPPTPTEDPLHLFQQAEQTVAHLTAYLASDGHQVPPIWNDFATEATAADTRARLHLRMQGRTPAGVTLNESHWRMDQQRAVLDAGYRAGGRRSREQGQIHIEMSRREQRWLVTRLHLEPAP